MRKKTLLIGITSSILMVATLSAALINNGSFKVFAQNNTSNLYTAVISTSNRLKATNSSEEFAFQLHGNDEYALFYMPKEWYVLNPTGIYSDYFMSWTQPEGQKSSYFEISIEDQGEGPTSKNLIDGKYYYLRGFPGAYRITTVYALSDPDIRVEINSNNRGWAQTSRVVEGNLITEVTEKGSGNQGINMDWSLWTPGTIYIKSITIEYTCS